MCRLMKAVSNFSAEVSESPFYPLPWQEKKSEGQENHVI